MEVTSYQCSHVYPSFGLLVRLLICPLPLPLPMLPSGTNVGDEAGRQGRHEGSIAFFVLPLSYLLAIDADT